ncbi:hypothetical protein [Geodermatophilus obscurus]|uniref:hypothetical protein n=1 Tax=Geodermatophilus obscurus TaxID=1861 RepID=UPI0009427298|nr:hypothetical protein [Geodermatophilus obscurus]
MWRGDDGRLHTVALPEPDEIFTDAALPAVERVLERTDHEEVADLLERRELAAVEYWDNRPVDEETEAPFVDIPAPTGLFHRVVASLAELEAALAEVDPRWALDVALALDDLAGAE